ncbi:MAG TPA: hypothetical protein VD993_06355 [Chitinophagaceae bacterium]|nr:hypothetical protein [Chitinophagaceae bacterium]
MSPLYQWVPYKLLPEPEQVLCRWLHVGDKPFSEPFFDDTIIRCRSNTGLRPHVASNISMLEEWAAALPAVEPSAFIFHISRCGSTLVSQLLGMNPRHIVLSEVPFIDELLRAPFKEQGFPPFDQLPVLQAALRLYGQKRSGDEERLFIKTDSWHVFFYKTIRALYPDVPFVLLYREPREVMHSHRKKRGMQAVPGVIEPAVFGFEKLAVTDLDAYMAVVIEKYLSTFLEIITNDSNALLVNYNEGMLQVMEKIASFTDLALTEEEHVQMRERCGYHAKYPDQVFAEAAAPEEVPGYLEKSMALYKQVEAVRLQVNTRLTPHNV